MPGAEAERLDAQALRALADRVPDAGWRVIDGEGILDRDGRQRCLDLAFDTPCDCVACLGRPGAREEVEECYAALALSVRLAASSIPDWLQEEACFL